MAAQELWAPALGLAPDSALSTEIERMIAAVRPSVVQVRSAGRGGGAGVIWRSNGAILTNDHVVGNARQIEVQLPEGRSFETRVTARNAALDLALLEVNSNLPAALVGDSTRLRVGELVFAIGHPWGQRGIVTAGIVSGLGEVPVRGTNHTTQYIRSDVRLAPGNSGGPLLNAYGEVIGINAMIFGGDLGVAIPSHVAITWIAGLPSRGTTLGVQVQTIELPAVLRQGVRAQRIGLLVVGVSPGGLAERSGLLVGDALLQAAGTPLESPEALRGVLNQNKAPRITISILRAGALETVEVHS